MEIKQKKNRTLILNFLLIPNIEELAVWCPKKGDRVGNYSTVRTRVRTLSEQKIGHPEILNRKRTRKVLNQE